MLIRSEQPADIAAVDGVHAAAFARRGAAAGAGRAPEVDLLTRLRASSAWQPRLSFVAVDAGVVVGHVCCTRALLDAEVPVLGLGPLGVVPACQGGGAGTALVYTVLGGALALDEQLVCVLGAPRYYRRFGFVPARTLHIDPPDPAWADSFQARPLSAAGALLTGHFSYAEPFSQL